MAGVIYSKGSDEKLGKSIKRIKMASLLLLILVIMFYLKYHCG